MQALNQIKHGTMLTILLLIYGSAISQSKDSVAINPSEIHFLAKAYGDSIVLRWGPQSAEQWTALNTTGYVICRFNMTEQNKINKVLLNDKAIKPWPLEAMREKLEPDTMAAVAAQALYGKSFGTPVNTASFTSMAAKSDEMAMRFSFAMLAADWDAGAASALGLRWVDKNVKPGIIYYYQIYPYTELKEVACDTGRIVVLNKPAEDTPRPHDLKILAGDKHIVLNWPRLKKQIFSGFFLEKSIDGGKTFLPLNKRPYLPPQPNENKFTRVNNIDNNYSFSDSIKENYKTYMYRIRGINSFGELSPYSDTISCQGHDLTPPLPPHVLSPVNLGGREVKISWTKEIQEADLAGYYIYKAKNNKSYKLLTTDLLKKTQFSYIDTAAFEHAVNYYYVIAIDTAGNYASSTAAIIDLPDTFAPAAPRGLHGSIDKQGHVNIGWAANNEEDLEGYRVFYANNDKYIFIPRTNAVLKEPFYTDSITLQTLSKSIYYRIKAIDQRGNLSQFSEVLTLKKPDILPPTAPLITNILLSDKKVSMDIIESTSLNASGYVIYRKEKNSDWLPIARVNQDRNKQRFTFIDTTLKANTTYLYTAETFDTANLHSEKCVAKTITYYAKAHQPAINTLAAFYDKATHSVKLKWDYKTTGDYFFIIYRSSGKGMQRLISLNPDINTFADSQLDKHATAYQYTVQAVFKDPRGETSLGEPVKIELR